MFEKRVVNRRDFLAAGAMTALCFGKIGFAQNPDRKPNILLFVADDHTAIDCGAYGHKIIQTPNLDRLAAQSLKFSDAYAASPTCVPSRSSIYSGLMPARHGAHPNHSKLNPGVKTLPDYMKPLGYTTGIFGKIHVKPEEQLAFDAMKPSQDSQILANLRKWFSEYDGGKPFCLVVATHDPHVPWEYDPQYGYTKEGAEIPSSLIDTEETRQARTDYYSDVSRMDEILGRTMDLLEKQGVAADTVLVYTADQGAQWPFAKWNLYDSGIRLPLLIRRPGKIKGGSSTDAFVSQADFLATFIDLAGGSVPADLDSKSFLPVLEGRSNEHREMIFATHTGDGNKNMTPMRCIRTRKYKYILNLAPEANYTTHIDLEKKQGYWDSWLAKAQTDEHSRGVLKRYHTRPEEELYDLEADPQETKNLADDPAHAEVLDDLRKKLNAWRKQQGEI